MRRFFIAAAGVAAVAGFIVIDSCTGPTGPAGPAGLDGKKDTVTILTKDTLTILKKDTVVMRDSTCRVCHDKGQGLIVAKKFEWSTTEHAVGVGFSAALGKSSCARCHSGHGFVTQVVNGKAKNTTDTLNMSNINCRTCHNIHTKYDTTDWALSDTLKAAILVKPTDSLNFGKGNLCIQCHQALGTNPIDTLKTDSIKVTNRFFGAHYGTQTNILIGMGGCESICSTTTKPAEYPITAAKVPNGCVACHVSKLNGENHNFMPTKATVGAAVPTINIDTTKAKIDTLLAEVRDSLIARKIIKKDSTAEIGVSMLPPAAGTMFPKKVAGACWNYMIIKQDKSHGIHNFPYVFWLLQNSLAVLKQ